MEHADRTPANPYWRYVIWVCVASLVGAVVATSDLFDFPGKCIDMLGKHGQAMLRPKWDSTRLAMFSLEVKLFPVVVAFIVFGVGMLWELRKARKAHADSKERADSLSANENRLVTLEKERDELKRTLEDYRGFDMVLGATSDDFDVMEQLYVARIAVSHNGKRTAIDASVMIEGFAPISKNTSVTAMCQSFAPVALWPKHGDRNHQWTQQHGDYGQFEVHTGVPLIVDVAFLFQLQAGGATSMNFGPRISNAARVPSGDYIVVLVATARHATPVRMAFTVGDADGEPGRPNHIKRRIVMEPLRKSIGAVLGADHWLAKEFDQKIVPHRRAAS
jgi:hypothetical protein